MRARILDLIRRAMGTTSLTRQIEALDARLTALAAALPAPAPPPPPGLTAADRDAILHQINYTNHNLYLHLKEAMRVRELANRDLLLAIDRLAHLLPNTPMLFEAERPIAIDTDDHLFPWGAAQDNTRSPRFVAACERHFPGRPLTFMDLGCSGGGLVLDFILRGHAAYGVEGSDAPMRAQRAEWRLLRHNLFTGDITRPFALRPAAGAPHVACDVISAWEVMEHIADEDLPGLFANLRSHLAPDGLFIGSIALGPDDNTVTGARYHRTVQPQDWWEARFAELGLPMLRQHGFAFEDFCRGTSNGPIDENYRSNPHIGFHFVARRA